VTPAGTGAQAFVLAEDHVLFRLERPALVTGIVVLALCALGGWFGPAQFFHSYLIGFMFWFGVALGSLAILMVSHLTGGAWGAVVRRLLESASRTLPVLALLFLPILFGLGQLYEWARPDAVARDGLLQHKHLYLNVPFFVVRAILYFTVWITVAGFLSRWSLEQDRSNDPAPGRRLELLSRGGLVLYGLTVTFAAVDWVMSLEPRWFSSIFGFLFMGAQGLAAFAFVIPVAAFLAQTSPLAQVIERKQFHDLGNLMLAFVMIWAYLAFSQLLIIWSGNLPEEISWYLHRSHGGWFWIGIGLIVFHFALPFVVLLLRAVKQNPGLLALVALLVIAARFFDLLWLIGPSLDSSRLHLSWMDVLAPIGVGGIWLAAFIAGLRGRPLVPLNDPSLPEIAHE